jgi:hypothetical protein
MITKIPELKIFSDRYETMNFEPLLISVKLKSAIALYDPLYLDNLLARCVLEQGLKHTVLERAYYDLPVPLKHLWISPEGFPLWAASVLFADGEEVKDTVYLHKRLERFEFSEKQPKSNVGRWMDRRVPMQTYVCHRLQAFCVGNANEISRLLPIIRFLGKRRNVGFGEIDNWDIQSWNGNDIDTMVYNNKLIHAIPEQAKDVLGLKIDDSCYLVGWTPPQWKPELFSMGWRVGTVVKT